LLSAGSRVGPYKVLGPLGAGGMGEVYQARDPRLGRNVAVKLLSEGAAADPERLRRFRREARAVASLNHPHILAVYDIGSDDGTDYVVFELLEGQTLRQRLESGPLPARKVVEYGVQICRGLAAAHGQGIVHRDLKPENLFLTAGGQVKILDFGLAKQTGPSGPEELSRAETRTTPTEAGRVMGTVGYMSPEQVQGLPVDTRSDLFALGGILYEMLSGRRAFAGTSAADTLAALLRSDPPEIQREGVPPGLERVVRRCLEKEPGERFQSAHDLGLALETLSGPAAPTPRPPEQDRGRRRSAVVAAMTAMVVLAGVASWWLWSRRPVAPGGPVQIVPFTADGGFKYAPRLSPDGQKVAYSWTGPEGDNWDVYVKAIGPGTRPLRLTESEAGDWGPVWSPDGQRIAFIRELETGAAIYTVPSLGGQERRLVEVAGVVRPREGFLIPALSWSPDGEWLALSEQPDDDHPARVVRLSLTTLERQPLTSPPAESLGDFYPELSPDGRYVAFVRAASRSLGLHDVWVQALGQSTARRLTFGNYDYCSGSAWTPDSRELVFAAGTDGITAGGRILRVRLAGGDPIPLAGVGGDVAGPSIRANRMVHEQLTPAPVDIWRLPSRSGASADRRLEALIASRWNDEFPAYSPDGHRIAFESDRTGDWSVWVSDVESRNPVQLTTFSAALLGAPAPWSPDGRKIVVSAESGSWDLYLVDTEGGQPRRLTHESSADMCGSFSRDGRFIYFSSDRGGRPQIWKMPAAGGPAVQVTQDLGLAAQESEDARAVYYSNDHGIWRLPLEGGEKTPVLRVGEGRVLRGWDLVPEGIYYADLRYLNPEGQDYAVRLLDLESGRTETLFSRRGRFEHFGLSLSPDAKWILYGEQPLPRSELMLVENFR
jgi:Tol biopolymer transport system component